MGINLVFSSTLNFLLIPYTLPEDANIKCLILANLHSFNKCNVSRTFVSHVTFEFNKAAGSLEIAAK